MSIRNLAKAFLLAIIMNAIAVSGYAFSVSQVLGRGQEQNLNTFKLIHVGDLKALMAGTGNKVHVYDANIKPTRERFGTIPGAVLLASDENYPLSVLPPNKHAMLVFYCADNH
jgi:hypothetical protein